MIAETHDPALVNAFANHCGIRPFLGGGEGPLDFSGGMKPPNVFLFGEHGGFLYGWMGPGTYEGHVMLTLTGRGRWGVEAGRQSIRMMAERGMTHMWCRVHPDRPEIATYVRLCGLHDTGETNELDIGDGPVRWRIFNWRA